MGEQTGSLPQRAQGFVSRCSDRALSLWAKSGDESGWLCLPWHMVDSACVAEQLWDKWVPGRLKGVLAEKVGLTVGETGKLVAWLAGAHDCGKATISFQCQLESRPGFSAFADRIVDAGLPLVMRSIEADRDDFKHAVASEVIQTEYLCGLGLNRQKSLKLASVAGAHHGIASSSLTRRGASDVLLDMAPEWREVQTELLDMITDLCDVGDTLTRVNKLDATSTELLTGIVVMADWIASNSRAFPMIPDPRNARVDQQARVEDGLGAISITSPWEVPSWNVATLEEFFAQLFGWDGNVELRSAQSLAVRAAEEAHGPTMFIVEAPTGSGKTEAASAAAQILAERSEGEQGVIFAAPTMATANGLFKRVTEWAKRNTSGGQVSSMFLAHSKRDLSEQYQALRVNGVGEDAEVDNGSEAVSGDVSSGQVVATEWLSGRKRGLLSNFVVGTVDQVLMLALQMRHSMLRHLGLAGKIVIIDEAHSYDLFMSEYLVSTLKWLSRYGVSVIVMSATLPKEQKRKIAAAYQEKEPDDIPKLDDAYPAITAVGKKNISCYAGEIGPNEAHVALQIVDDSPGELTNLLRAEMMDGGCVLVMCNTIRRAQNAYLELKEAGIGGQIELHHSAFMASHRSRKEEELLYKLGPQSHRGDGRPESLIVVATQVAEQSLDIDVDMLVTDIAPMDLLVQRMGRLHRHQRPGTDRPTRLRAPRCFIRGIQRLEPVPQWDPGAAAVYDESILASTLAALQQNYLPDGWNRPADIAPAVHAVYQGEPAIPESWRQTYDSWRQKSEERRAGQRKRAAIFRIPDPAFAANLQSLFARMLEDRQENSDGKKVLKSEEALTAQVRDADPAFEVIPIIGDGEYYRGLRWQEEEKRDIHETLSYRDALELASDTLRLPSVFSNREQMFTTTIDELESVTPQAWQEHFLLRGQVALVLDEDGETELAGRRLRYTMEFGLEQINEQKVRPDDDV